MSDISRRLGYGGSATVGGVQVIITSGSFEQANTPSYLPMVDTPPSATSRARVLHADGTASYTGSLGFDLSVAAMSVVTTSTLLGRGYKFNVGINDGNDAYQMTDCLATSVALTGAPGGIVSVSLSFMAQAGKASTIVTNNFIRDPTSSSGQMVGYWWSGGPDVRDWSLTMSQAVELVYGNKNSIEPLYLRYGLVDYILTANIYKEVGTLFPDDTIAICTTKFQLTGKLQAKGYTFSGVTELGTYAHTFETSALNDASGTVIQVVP